MGQVRTVDAAATAECGIQALMMNTFHLMQKPGATTVKSLGGLHRFSGWEKAIFTDSGGFQAYSLIRQNSKFGSLTDNGMAFLPENGEPKNPANTGKMHPAAGQFRLGCHLLPGRLHAY